MKVTYTYDILHRLVEAAWDDGRRVLYIYDAAGNRLSVSLPAVAAPPALPAAHICPQCGAQNSPTARFCRQCGARQEAGG